MFDEAVSIITPTYNSIAYIEKTIISVLKQTYQNWELLIVDDCSTDNSCELIKKFVALDSRIKYLKTDQPSGSPTLPRNIGIQHASGRFIAFLDSDDVWLSNKLEEQIGLFEDKNTAIVFSNYEKIDEDGNRAGRCIVAPDRVSYKKLLLGNVMGCLTVVIDTAKVGKTFFSNIHHEDYVLWLSILKKGFIARNTNTVTALYRVRKQSVSSNKLSVLSWQWNIYINIEKTGYLKGIYYFINYALRAYRKALK